MALNLCIIYASFMCSGPQTIYQVSPLMSKHGNWAPLLMILAANTSVDRKSVGTSTHCHNKVSSRRLCGRRSCFFSELVTARGTLHNMMQRSSTKMKEEDAISTLWLKFFDLRCEHMCVFFFSFHFFFFFLTFEVLFVCVGQNNE